MPGFVSNKIGYLTALNRHSSVFFIYLFVNLFVDLLFSADVTLRTTVDKNPVGINETFLYTIEISGKSTNLPTPDFPSLDEFTILSGPNTSTNIQFINGAMTSSKSYSFYLSCPREGTFTIPSATIEVDNEVVSSNAIELNVIKGNAPAKSQEKSVPQSKDEAIGSENLYLKTVVDKTSAYPNEQILVKYILYFRVNVRTYSLDKVPANPGFWMEEFKLPAQPSTRTEIVNGLTYQVATLRKVALFPTRSGELSIEPMIISVDAVAKSRRRSRSIFDDFFNDPFGQTIRKTLTSQPIKINVKPFPVKGKPSDFEGVTGKYNMTLNSDKLELKANEAASIKLSIRGEGNLKLLNAPDLKLPADMEVYDPKEKTSITRENDKIGGSKIIEYVVLPRFKGTYKIDPVTFSYFDPAKKDYVQLKTQPITMKVLEGDATTSGLLAGSSLSKQEVALLGEDIRYIKERTEFYLSGQKLYQNWIYLLSYLIPLLGLAIAWRYSVNRNRLRGNIELARKRKAGKIAAKHLTKAKLTLKSGDKEEFYRATTLALQGFVCDRLNQQISDFNLTKVEKDLKKAGLGDEEVEEYLACLQESDFQRYSGTDAGVGELKSFYERVKKILTHLERYL